MLRIKNWFVSLVLALLIVACGFTSAMAQQVETQSLIHISEGAQPDCRIYVNNVSANEAVCYVPAGVLLGTNSDIYYSPDQWFFSEDFLQGENYINEGWYLYAPWGMSFWVVYEPTPEPTPTTPTPTTPAPTATATLTPTVTATATPSVTPVPTETVVPSVTPSPTETVIPTETVVPTTVPTETVVPTATVAPTSTPVIIETPIFTITNILVDCRNYVTSVMNSGDSCFVAEDYVLSTESDVYVSEDFIIYQSEFLTGTSITGPMKVYGPWGASFILVSEPITVPVDPTITPIPSETPTATPTPTVDPNHDNSTFLPNIEGPAEGQQVVFNFQGNPLNCADFITVVSAPETVCQALFPMKTSSDVYISDAYVFNESQLHKGGYSVNAGQMVYMKWGASFEQQ